MIKYIIAKTNPFEDLSSHHEKTIKAIDNIFNAYGEKVMTEEEYLFLKFLAGCHDVGKNTNVFFNQIINRKNEKKNKDISTIKHNILGYFLIDKKKYSEKMKKLGISTEKFSYELFRDLILNHHSYNDFNNEIMEYFKKEDIVILNKELNKEILNNSPQDIKIARPGKNTKYCTILFDKFLGFLKIADYCASSNTVSEHSAKELKIDDIIKDFIESNFGEMNDLQKFMYKNQEKSLIIIAETGMGKTEASLLWIGQNKGFFLLPLRSAINSIYERTVNCVKEKDKNLATKVGILHSDAEESRERAISKIDNLDNFIDYENQSKMFSLPLNISTVDQILHISDKSAKKEFKLARLSYSKIVIDEIQMYDEELLAKVVYGIIQTVKMGGKFAIVTATFPGFLLNELNDKLKDCKNYEEIKEIPIFIKNDRVRHLVEVKEINKNLDGKTISQFIKKNESIDLRPGKQLIIVNTVGKALRLKKELKKEFPDREINLIHSKMIKNQRGKKEKKIMMVGSNKFLSEKDIGKDGIWIGTQVVEASLDIDFDYLYTELSDVTSFFQRLGRCYRKRTIEDGRTHANCYLFVTRRDFFINEEIYEKSKKSLIKWSKNNKDLRMSERNKLDIIEEIYSEESMKGTDYFKTFKDKLGSLIRNGDTSSEMRDINSVFVIPEKLFNENKLSEEIKKIERLTDFKNFINDDSDEICKAISKRKKLFTLEQEIKRCFNNNSELLVPLKNLEEKIRKQKELMVEVDEGFKTIKKQCINNIFNCVISLHEGELSKIEKKEKIYVRALGETIWKVSPNKDGSYDYSEDGFVQIDNNPSKL